MDVAESANVLWWVFVPQRARAGMIFLVAARQWTTVRLVELGSDKRSYTMIRLPFELVSILALSSSMVRAEAVASYRRRG